MKRTDTQIIMTHKCPNCGHIDLPSVFVLSTLHDNMNMVTSPKVSVVDVDEEGEPVTESYQRRFVGGKRVPDGLLTDNREKMKDGIHHRKERE